MNDRIKYHRREMDKCQQRLKDLSRYGTSGLEFNQVLEFHQVMGEVNYHKRQIKRLRGDIMCNNDARAVYRDVLKHSETEGCKWCYIGWAEVILLLPEIMFTLAILENIQ